MNERKIWLVEHPLHQYKEDVKALARKNDLRIIDAEHKASIDPATVEDKPPKLTKLGAEKSAQAGE